MGNHQQLRDFDLERSMNSLFFIGIFMAFLMTNFVWYWTGHKDGIREGYTRGRAVSRSEFWKE